VVGPRFGRANLVRLTNRRRQPEGICQQQASSDHCTEHCGEHGKQDNGHRLLVRSRSRPCLARSATPTKKPRRILRRTEVAIRVIATHVLDKAIG
jgi:hypothetical protein